MSASMSMSTANRIEMLVTRIYDTNEEIRALRSSDVKDDVKAKMGRAPGPRSIWIGDTMLRNTEQASAWNLWYRATLER